MKLTVKEWIFATIAIVAIIAFGYMFNLNEYNKEQYTKVAQVNAGLGEQIKKFKDENGVLHSRIEVMEVDKQAYIAANREALDSLADALDIKLKNIKGLLNITTQTIGAIETKLEPKYEFVPIPGPGIVKHDTIQYYAVNYKDAWMDFKGRLDKSKFTATYTITDSLSFTTYQKATGFLGLGPKKTYLDVQAKNPNTNFTNMKNVQLTKVREKLFSLGVYVGYGFNGTTFEPQVGIGFQRSILRF